MARALVPGDPHSARIVKQSSKGKIEGVRDPVAMRARRSSAAPSSPSRSSLTRFPPTSPSPTGRLRWDSTTLVVVEARSEGRTGLGYTYVDGPRPTLIDTSSASVVEDATR